MEGAGDSFSEDDMRLFRDAFMGTNALEEQMEALISRYNGLGEDDEEEEDDGEIRLTDLDFGFLISTSRHAPSDAYSQSNPARLLTCKTRSGAGLLHEKESHAHPRLARVRDT